MFLRTETLSKKKLVGKSAMMSLATYNPVPLWQAFMPIKKTLENTCGDLISLQIYPHNFDGNPTTLFEKWVCVEVLDTQNVPVDLAVLDFPAGEYAVFLHQGTTEKFRETLAFIHCDWLPSSEYEIDDRPHFEVLGKKYKHNDATSEEEVWIPIKPRFLAKPSE